MLNTTPGMPINPTVRTSTANVPRQPRKLYNREDSRRLAATFIKERARGGEIIDVSTRRMKALPANVLAQYASMPSRFRRGLVLDMASDDCVVLRLGTRY